MRLVLGIRGYPHLAPALLAYISNALQTRCLTMLASMMRHPLGLLVMRWPLQLPITAAGREQWCILHVAIPGP
jgi:hypothetical protein